MVRGRVRRGSGSGASCPVRGCDDDGGESCDIDRGGKSTLDNLSWYQK